MGGAVIYRYEAVAAMKEADLLGRAELAATGLQEDHIFGLCLFSLGYRSVNLAIGMTNCLWGSIGRVCRRLQRN